MIWHSISNQWYRQIISVLLTRVYCRVSLRAEVRDVRCEDEPIGAAFDGGVVFKGREGDDGFAAGVVNPSAFLKGCERSK